MSQSTLALFHHFYDHLPPLLPKDVVARIERALVHAAKPEQTITSIEDMMIASGYEVWPWQRAANDMTTVTTQRLRERIFVSHLTPELLQKYREALTEGVAHEELERGRMADFFTLEERAELRTAFLITKSELRALAEREIKGLRQKEYLNLVTKYTTQRDEMAEVIGHLRQRAQRESEHQLLVDEIRAFIRGFEYGLIQLGPEVAHNDVLRAPEFFAERKLHLNRLRGIHLPLAIQFL